MKKLISLIVCALLAAMLLLTGCERESKEGPYIFYLSLDGTSLVPEKMRPEGDSPQDKAMYYLEKMQLTPESGNLRQTIPANIGILDTSYNGYLYTVVFNDDYYKMSVTDEVLTRAAIVRTLTQIDGISYVSFMVENAPLLDTNGNYVGSMTADSFVENPGAQINSSITTTINLYFSSESGDKLVKETRTITHSSNTSIEKLIMTQLMKGTKKAKLKPTIPLETKLINISTVDGVCYVNLDETIQNQDETISEEVVLYSIVNSLAELNTVDSVQISINGATNKKFRYLFELSKPFSYNKDLIYDFEDEVETEEEVETEDLTQADISNENVNTNAGVTDVMNQMKEIPNER